MCTDIELTLRIYEITKHVLEAGALFGHSILFLHSWPKYSQACLHVRGGGSSLSLKKQNIL